MEPLCNASEPPLRPEARMSSGNGELQFLGWNVPPDQIQYIPEHWLTQLEPPASMHYMLGVFYIFLFCASTCGNGMVIWIFSTSKSLRTPSNMFVLNLAVFDLIMCLKAPIFIYNSFHRGFALGNTWCQIFASIGSYSGIGAGMTNAAIGYDRYNVITKPMNRNMTFTKAVVMNIIIWLYCTPWVVLPLTQFWDRFVPGELSLFISSIYLSNLQYNGDCKILSLTLAISFMKII